MGNQYISYLYGNLNLYRSSVVFFDLRMELVSLWSIHLFLFGNRDEHHGGLPPSVLTQSIQGKWPVKLFVLLSEYVAFEMRALWWSVEHQTP